MKTAIVGTAQGIFVVDAAGGGSSRGLAGPSVRHLSRVNGHCLAGSTAGVFLSPDGGRTWQASGIGDREVHIKALQEELKEATDNAARAAAAFENKVIDLEGSSGGGARGLLRSILWDLTQSEFQQESSRLAEVLQNGLDRALRLPSRGVKQAPFYVLGGAAMPAVLVEIGFITNPQEEQRLRDDGYRDRIARALAAGVAAYKRSYDQRLGVVARR